MKIGSYSWFREHGHTRLQALKRCLDEKIIRSIPSPAGIGSGVVEEGIDSRLYGLDNLIETVSSDDYSTDKSLRPRNTPEMMILNIYKQLQEIPPKYFSDRTITEYQRIEALIKGLQFRDKLPES